MPRIFLAGAGPGSSDLLTLKTARLLAQAEVVLHDSLVGPDVLALINQDAEIIDVGKRCGQAATAQAEICRLLVQYAATGKLVVRLKGGDPVIFGRLTEEIEALRQANFDFEVVPGVTAASAAAASVGLSLTQRLKARSVHFITGHGADQGLPVFDWKALVQTGGTLAIYMGRKHLQALIEKLLQAGLQADIPAIIVESASLPEQRIEYMPVSSLLVNEAMRMTNGPVLVLIGLALS